MPTRRYTSVLLTRRSLQRTPGGGPEGAGAAERHRDQPGRARHRRRARRASARRRARAGRCTASRCCIKDNIDTADRMHDHGRLARPGRRDRRRRTRSSSRGCARPGAVILGKTNLSEWANFRSTHSTSGWSGRGGQTRNPYALDRNPSRLELRLGGGRRREPLRRRPSAPRPTARSSARRRQRRSSGIKPTVGLVSRAGIIPISHTQDTAGPMARTVARRGDPARRAGRRRPATTRRRRRATSSAPRGLHDVPRRRTGLQGARHRRRRASYFGFTRPQPTRCIEDGARRP